MSRRALHASVHLDGIVRVDGDLDPETGESLLTALAAVMDAEVRWSSEHEDRRSPAERRADALGEICRAFLDRADRPSVGGERPHLTITVDLGTLTGRPPDLEPADVGVDRGSRVGELDHVGPVSERLIRRLACDASVMRVVMAGRSEPLDVGRRTPVVSPALRRAVIVRDRRCRFPGCERPSAWSEAHHVVHWADGGSTSLSNLVLLCRRHHRLVHTGFGLELQGSRPVFRRPDGSLLEDRAPPERAA